MISKKMEKALNGQRVQVQEEQFHAMKFYDYIIGRGGRVILRPIEAPPSDWDSPLAVFEATLTHEQKVTGLINDLMDLARGEKDNASEIFLQWFINEQVEEEDNVSKVLGQLKLIKDSPQALFMMDREMGQRVFTPPAAAEGGV
ncbi:MAG: ferritin [Planctomycetota bacterium]|jgi:ferritin